MGTVRPRISFLFCSWPYTFSENWLKLRSEADYAMAMVGPILEEFLQIQDEVKFTRYSIGCNFFLSHFERRVDAQFCLIVPTSQLPMVKNENRCWVSTALPASQILSGVLLTARRYILARSRGYMRQSRTLMLIFYGWPYLPRMPLITCTASWQRILLC